MLPCKSVHAHLYIFNCAIEIFNEFVQHVVAEALRSVAAETDAPLQGSIGVVDEGWEWNDDATAIAFLQ